MGDGGLAPVIINLKTGWRGEFHSPAELCPGRYPCYL